MYMTTNYRKALQGNGKARNLNNAHYLLVSFQINLRLILVSGKTKEFLFSPSDSAGDIAQIVFDSWPEGK